MSFNSKRIGKDTLLRNVIILLSVLACVPLFLILGNVFVKGIGQFSLDFFTQTPPDTLSAKIALNNKEQIPGGIANGIVGTLMTVVIASIIAIPLGLLCGIWLSEFRERKSAGVIRFIVELLQGMPSIIIGIIAYLWIVVPTRTYSAFAGAISLAIMMLPMIIRSTEESLRMLPHELKEAGLALGGSLYTVTFKVLIPTAFGGIMTGILLAISRVIGETAPLMLTALGASAIQWNPMKPSSTISLLIWEFYNDPNLQSLIWSASLLLLILVLLLNLIAKQIAKQWKI